MSRWKAGFIHLIISAVIVLVVLAVMKWVWYPSAVFVAVGGGGLVLILAAVDLILGPFLTTVIFKSGKPRLNFDLLVIGLLQFGALAYGAYVVFVAKPAYLVFAVDQFEIVVGADIDKADFAKVTNASYQGIPLGRYQLVGALLPADPKEREQVLMRALTGRDLPYFPQYYVPYAGAVMKQTSVKAQPIAKLEQLNPGRTNEIRDWIVEHKTSSVEAGFLPVKASKQDASAIVKRDTGELIGLMPVKPW
jgi:hypothetical protein